MIAFGLYAAEPRPLIRYLARTDIRNHHLRYSANPNPRGIACSRSAISEAADLFVIADENKPLGWGTASQRDDLRLNCRRSLRLLQERTQCLFIRAQ